MIPQDFRKNFRGNYKNRDKTNIKNIKIKIIEMWQYWKNQETYIKFKFWKLFVISYKISYLFINL